MSARAFALSIGAPPKRVRLAIRQGKLRRGVAIDAAGRAMIVDAEGAALEWATLGAKRSPRSTEPIKAGLPTSTVVGPLIEARRALYDAQKARIDQALAERRGDLVSVAALERLFGARVVITRTRLLGVPSRLRQRFPDLEPVVLGELERLLREALEEAASASLDPAEPASEGAIG